MERFRTHTLVVSALDYPGEIIALIVGSPLLHGSDRCFYYQDLVIADQLQTTLAGVTPFSYSIYGSCVFNLTQVCIYCCCNDCVRYSNLKYSNQDSDYRVGLQHMVLRTGYLRTSVLLRYRSLDF